MSSLSFWGWGFADRFPDDDTRRGIAGMIEARVGFGPTGFYAPPVLEQLAIPESRLALPAGLSDVASTSAEARIRHTYGRSYRDVLRGFFGDFSGAPDVVAMPKLTADLDRLYEFAQKNDATLTPYGGGTSVVSGIEADRRKPSITVDMRNMDRVLEVDLISRAAQIQAGASGPRIAEQLKPHGLTMRFYPQSYEHATLGGLLATRAGGHFATVYTHIDDLLESVEMWTPKGLFSTRRLPESGAGPSPNRLVLGSEGTLGIVTQAWMRVFPRPTFRISVSMLFRDFYKGVEAARRIAQAGLFPSNCRLLDGQEAALNLVTFGDDVGKSVLIVGFETAEDPRVVVAAMDLAVELVRKVDSTVEMPRGIIRRQESESQGDSAGVWKGAFLEAPYLQSVLVSVGIMADTFETACTWDRFEAVHEGITERVEAAMKQVCGAGRLGVRFTHVYPDGPAPYYTFLAPVRRGEELQQWSAIKQAASDALHELGATITHHHAVGRMHRPWYNREVPALFGDVLRATKRTLDPESRMNPGVLIDP